MSDQKVWFVTGAFKRLGLSLVKLRLSRGKIVAVTSRKIDAFEAVHVENRENLLPLAVDPTSDESVKAAIDQTVEKFGQLDVVVNNAAGIWN